MGSAARSTAKQPAEQPARRDYAANDLGPARIIPFPDQPLSELANKALQLTDADGVAIAIAAEDAFVCRARTGRLAPELGAVVHREAGISGACIASRSLLVCHDVACDPRVDGDACRALGI